MTSNPEPMVQHVPGEVHTLPAYGPGAEPRLHTAYTGEWPRGRRRLALGAVLWRRCLVTSAARRPTEPGSPHAWLGETQPPRTASVSAYLEPLLAGPTDAVITALAVEGHAPTWTVPHRQAVRRTVGYSRRHRSYRPDDDYLARGWPSGTGVVERACEHLMNAPLAQVGICWPLV